MIVWINGAFGVGKTQTAYELHRRLPGSFVYDPEHAGFFLRENMPPALCPGDFQDHALWRQINAAMLNDLAERHGGDIIVPMTVVQKAYYDELIGALAEKYTLRHFILYAEKETVLKRLASRLETGGSWAARQIDRCIAAFDGEIPGEMLRTDGMEIGQVGDRIAAEAGLVLTGDRRSKVRKLFDRLAVQLKHIR